MSLPKMGKVLKRFEQPITIVTIVQEIVGVKPVETKTKHSTKAGAAGIKRAIWYDRTPKRVKFNEPLPIEFRPTQERDNSFKVPTVAKVGGCWLKYVNAFKYLDYEI